MGKNMGHVKKNGYTLLELIVVISIIALLIAGGVTTYSALMKQSRDGRRKADLENIRSALEMYRSNNGFYPAGTGTSTLSTAFTGTTKYMESIPPDPRTTSYIYYYTSDGTTYTLAAQLETTSTCSSGAPGESSCGTGNPCNYCTGPYGQK